MRVTATWKTGSTREASPDGEVNVLESWSSLQFIVEDSVERRTEKALCRSRHLH